MKREKENNPPEERLKALELQAVILDLDGVITQTARTHKQAWKEMFAKYLEDNPGKQDLMSDEDYIIYIDGKPRYDGVASFLESRKIELPFGSPEDPAEEKTICGLGNLKNRLFLDIIEHNGVETYENAIYQIKQWRSGDLKCAVVSSSKNCRKVLEAVMDSGFQDLAAFTWNMRNLMR